MIFLTHLLGSIVALVYFGRYFGIGSNSIGEKMALLAAAMLFSALPDADMVKSWAGKMLQPFSNILSFLFRHRGFLHSLFFAAIIYFAIRHLASSAFATAAAIGCLSHLVLDALTKEGIRPLSPLLKFRLHGPVTTGGILEKGILAAISVLLLLKLA